MNPPATGLVAAGHGVLQRALYRRHLGIKLGRHLGHELLQREQEAKHQLLVVSLAVRAHVRPAPLLVVEAHALPIVDLPGSGSRVSPRRSGAAVVRVLALRARRCKRRSSPAPRACPTPGGGCVDESLGVRRAPRGCQPVCTVRSPYKCRSPKSIQKKTLRRIFDASGTTDQGSSRSID